MKRRRRAKSPGNELRRLALAGRWAELRALLEERLERAPHDAEARAELERLNQGIPLRATESALVRQRREEKEMQEELAAELALFRDTPGMVQDWETELVGRRRRRVILIRRTLGKRLSAEEEAESAAYLAELNRLWSRSRRWRRGRQLLLIGTLLALLAATAASALRHRAEQAETALRQALDARSAQRVEKFLGLADSGINRLMNSRLPLLIDKARAWLRFTLQEERDNAQLIASLEAGHGSISTLPLARRAELERWLQTLPPKAEQRTRWQRLCQREADVLAHQRQEVEQRFRTPLPPLPSLGGNPQQDDLLLIRQEEELLPLAREWEAARELFSLEAGLGEPLQARLRELQLLREDIAAYERCLDLLPSARSYAHYRQCLTAHTPVRYVPALRLAGILKQLPDEEHLRTQMQNHGRQLPPGMLEAACSALLHGGPSFTPAFPANAQQLQLMEDIFTYRGLQKPLYEMSAATLPHVIIEERPQVSEESVSFTPSPLTPGFSLDTPRRITWHNPQGVYIRRIDATPLLRETGISREDFFSKANLPVLLGKLLRVEHVECPALARAFVFKRLLEVMREHEWPTMFGIAYAPTLRADARSFSALCRELPVPLEPGCWLKSTPETARAEEACARWLHERRHRHYADEIARNFGALVRVHPRYVGFVDAEGRARLFQQLPQGTLLWYRSADGLMTSPLGDETEEALPYSPVFIIAKD